MNAAIGRRPGSPTTRSRDGAGHGPHSARTPTRCIPPSGIAFSPRSLGSTMPVGGRSRASVRPPPPTVEETHFGTGFLPWHRAFLLRPRTGAPENRPGRGPAGPALRSARPQPLPHELRGTAGATGVVGFTTTNPLRTWSTDGVPGIIRGPFFNTQTQAARDQQSQPVLAEAFVTGHQGAFASLPNPLERNPHGRAHVSFRGYIFDIDTAARDPLFYLLHCNVDRLWAKWQWLRRRFDKTSTGTFPFFGRAGQAGRPGWATTCWTPCGPGTTSGPLPDPTSLLASPSRRRPPPPHRG